MSFSNKKITTKINNDIPIIEVVKSYGVELKNNRSACPIHNGRNTNNFSVDINKNSFQCFSCGAKSSVIDFVMKMDKINFIDAKNKLIARYFSNYEKLENNVQKQVINPPKKQIDDNTPISEKTLEIYAYFYSILKLTQRGKNYLYSRCLSDDTVRRNVKSIDKPEEVFLLLKSKFSIDDLKTAGLVNSKNSFSFYKPCLVFCHFENKKAVYFSNRNYSEDKIKSFKLTGIKQRFFQCGNDSNDIYIVEGQLDALSITQRYRVNTIATIGTMSIINIERIKKQYPKKNLIFIFDNDITGALSHWRIDFTQKITALNWNLCCPDVNNVYENIKSEFATIEETETFFRVKGNKDLQRFIPYIKQSEPVDNPIKHVKDFNDIIRYSNAKFAMPLKYKIND